MTRRTARGRAHDDAPFDHELARAARILAVRSRREAAGLFAGSYASAFRGGGMEFDESHPYQPGDDFRNIDWNAMARTGEPFVKRFREERDRIVLLALDVSASMAFASAGCSKARVAAHGAALLAAAAGRAGDRIGFVAFDEEVRRSVPPGRGAVHTWRVVRAAVRSGESAAAGTRLTAAIEAMRAMAAHRSIAILLSDFRGVGFDEPGTAAAEIGHLSGLARRHDVLSIVVHDPRDETLPNVGRIRLADPERPHGSLLLDSGSARARGLYRRAWQRRRRALERNLRVAGSDVLWLRSDHDPLRALMRFFHERAAHTRAARS